jgi:hypothetical protein
LLFDVGLFLKTLCVENVIFFICEVNVCRNKVFYFLLHFKITGLYLYMLVVETFTGENIKLRVYVIIGWGKVTFDSLITNF